MQGIQRQADYYSFMAPELEGFASESGASAPHPATEELSGVLSGPSIQPGILDTHDPAPELTLYEEDVNPL